MKKFFIIIFFIILIFPYTNLLIKVIDDEKLEGVTINAEKPTFSFENYLTGDFQKKYDDYYFQNYPYRNVSIKVYNQLRYNLFNKGTVVIGKDNYLFEEDYILIYLDNMYKLSNKKMNKIVNDLNKINEICKNNNVEFYVLITPSKLDFYLDYIPDKYYKIANYDKNKKTNYDLLINKLNSTNIKFYDSIEFLKHKEYQQPLFYKTGIHWSFTTSTYVLKDFIKYINETSKLQLNDFHLISIDNSNKAFYDEDLDLYSLLNIYSGKTDDKYYNTTILPQKKYEINTDLFFQGDSFCWQLIEKMRKGLFKSIDFSFYQQYIKKYDQNGKHTTEYIENNYISDEQLKNTLKNKDIIILEINKEQIYYWDNGFPTRLAKYLSEFGFLN